MTYTYRGGLTTDRELEYLRTKAEELDKRNRELTAENMVLKERLKSQTRLAHQANARVGVRVAQVAKLQGVVRNLKADKKALQSRIVGLKKVRPYKVYEEPQPAQDVPEIVGLSGPRGLLAAVEEAKQVRLKKRAA
jgi:chromosome segregation ATPase